MTDKNSSRPFVVTMRDGSTVPGKSDQNGARWSCRFGREVNVDRDAFDVTGGKRIDCSDCGRRRYFQQPPGDVFEMEADQIKSGPMVRIWLGWQAFSSHPR